ncbi:MAG TPA: DUF4129 domain-containing protein [Acidimicrobiales bacterium]|nr:DUF4129 domain-containing protein [Acidimicrobiales bacterium]
MAERQFRQPSKPWITRLEEWVVREFQDLFSALTPGSHGTLLGWVIIAVTVGAAAIMVTRFSRRVRREPAVGLTTVRGIRKSAADWAADAARHERAAEWRQALRCRYRALVAELAERGVVVESPGRTTREYQAVVDRTLPSATVEFGGASELFEAVWYGNRVSGREDDEQLQQLTRRVLAEAARR